MTPPATIVSSTPPAPAAAPPAAAPPTTTAAEWQTKIDALTKQISDSKEETAEATRTAKYWADKAKADKTAKPAAAAEEDDVDVLETITTKGAKGFDELATKRGFIRRDEVEELVNSKAAALTKEQELIGRFPDLKKKESDFFKATAEHYGDLVKAGTPQALAMELAAEKAELEFMRSGKIKLPGAEPTKEEKEAARLARIKAQGGGDGRQPAPSEEDDADLTPEQKHIAKSMGISEEAYAKRAKAGVAMKGLR